jgi:hypothetical protein
MGSVVINAGMSKLHIAEDLSLPIDAVTQTIAILAKRRAGKSYTMRRIAEQLCKAGQQIAMVDPKGDQWGIRSSADGKSPGLPIIILGGERGDVPLEPGSGEVVAKLVVEDRVSVLLDLSLFRKHEVATFMTAFLENLYRLKAREIYRTPLMLVIDEADAVAPQKPQKGEERMLGAAEDIVRRGGQRGIGCVLVTQRSAVLNKNVLTQAQMLVALRTIAPQDLAAMDAWIQVHGEPEQRKTLMESLPSLPVGDAWFWSPGWPTVDGIFKRVHVLPIETFDSGKTPEPGERRIEPKNLADVDIDALKKQMSATIERAKENDPAQLKREIAQLKKELTKAKAAEPKTEQKEVRVFTEKEIVGVQKIEDAFNRFNQEIANFGLRVHGVGKVVEALHAKANSRTAQRFGSAQATSPLGPIRQPLAAVSNRLQTAAPASNGSEVSGGLRRMMIALAQRPGLNKRQLGVRAGLSSTSGTFGTYLARLRSNGWIEGSESFDLTDYGREALGDYQPLPEGMELLNYWLGQLGNSGAGRMLKCLSDAYPQPMSKESLGEAAQISASSGTFGTYLAKLRTLELIEGRSELTAAREFFEE